MPSLRELKYGVDLLVANLANVYFQQSHKSLKSLRKILASRVCTDVKTGKQKHTNIRRIKKIKRNKEFISHITCFARCGLCLNKTKTRVVSNQGFSPACFPSVVQYSTVGEAGYLSECWL